jgi:DUF1365 family protein
VSERPEPVAALDLLFEAARIAHEASFELHRRLVGLEADDDHTRSLLHESARLALDELPAVTDEARRLADRWREQSLLDPDAADERVQDLRVELDRLGPDLDGIRDRQREIARELRSRVGEGSGR